MVFVGHRGGEAASVNYLEYIQGTGTQYINTEFKADQNTRVVVDFEFVSNISSGNFAVIGARTEFDEKNYSFSRINTAFRSDFNNLYEETWEVPANTRYIVDKNGPTTIFNGDSKSYLESQFQCDYNLYIFSLNNAGVAQWISAICLYSCKIYDNGTLIRDYRPAKDPSGAVCLYDQVTRQYVYNAGTGVFTAGPEL